MIHGEISTFLKSYNNHYTRTIRHVTAENLQTLKDALSIVPWQGLLSNEDSIDEMVKIKIFVYLIQSDMPQTTNIYIARDTFMQCHVARY